MSDIEFVHRRIVIRQSKPGEGWKIPLRSAFADEFIRWKPHSRGSRWIFPARFDVAEAMQSTRKGWSGLCAKVVVILLRPHDLRRNIISQPQTAGISDSIIMSIGGHKTHVMLHRYSHANDEHKRRAPEALPDHQINVSGDVVSIRRIKTYRSNCSSHPELQIGPLQLRMRSSVTLCATSQRGHKQSSEQKEFTKISTAADFDQIAW